MYGIQFIVVSPNLINVTSFHGGLAELQAAVGGSIEAAPSDPIVTIWCNEDGIGLGLLHNAAADVVWSLYDVFGCLASGDHLLGNIVITGGTDDHGDTMDLPVDEARRIFNHIMERTR